MVREKKDFYTFVDKMGILNYILWLFVLNLLFWVTTFPTAIILLFLDLNIVTLGLLFGSMFLIGPSFASVTYSLYQLQDGNEKFVRNYFSFYRKWALKYMAYCAPYVILIGIVGINLGFLGQMPKFRVLYLGNMFLICFIITHLFNFILISVRHETGLKKTVGICLQLMIFKSFRFNVVFMLLISTFVIFSRIPVYLIFYGISIFALLAIKMIQPIWKEEEKCLELSSHSKNV